MESAGQIIGFEGEIHLRATTVHGLRKALEAAVHTARALEEWSIGEFGVAQVEAKKPKPPLRFELNYKGQGIPLNATSDVDELYALWKPHFERAKAQAASR